MLSIIKRRVRLVNSCITQLVLVLASWYVQQDFMQIRAVKLARIVIQPVRLALLVIFIAVYHVHRHEYSMKLITVV